MDVVVDSASDNVDVGACAVSVEAAGGRFTDLEGRPFTPQSTGVLATNGRLHQSIHDAIHA